MGTFQRITVAAVSGVAAALLAAPVAFAAPVNSPQTGEVFTLRCPGGDVAVVTPPGKGTYTPGFIVGTHELFIPYSFVFTVTNAAGEIIDSQTQAKGAPIPAGAVTCTLSDTFTENGATFTFNLEVTAVIRGGS